MNKWMYKPTYYISTRQVFLFRFLFLKRIIYWDVWGSKCSDKWNKATRKRKYFQGCEHGAVRGSMEVAVTSEIMRRSYITRQSWTSLKDNKGTGWIRSRACLQSQDTWPLCSWAPRGSVLRMECFFPQSRKGVSKGPTTLSASRGTELLQQDHTRVKPFIL